MKFLLLMFWNLHLFHNLRNFMLLIVPSYKINFSSLTLLSTSLCWLGMNFAVSNKTFNLWWRKLIQCIFLNKRRILKVGSHCCWVCGSTSGLDFLQFSLPFSQAWHLMLARWLLQFQVSCPSKGGRRATTRCLPLQHCHPCLIGQNVSLAIWYCREGGESKCSAWNFAPWETRATLGRTKGGR